MMEVEVIRIDPKEKRRTEIISSFAYVRAGAANLFIEQLLKFKKKIPKKGLNNTGVSGCYTDRAMGGCDYGATLPVRMEKLRWSIPYLPPQMVTMGMNSAEFDKERTKAALIEVQDMLANLSVNLDTVTVAEPYMIEYWREMIGIKERYLRRVSLQLGLIQKGGFEVQGSAPKELT